MRITTLAINEVQSVTMMTTIMKQMILETIFCIGKFLKFGMNVKGRLHLELGQTKVGKFPEIFEIILDEVFPKVFCPDQFRPIETLIILERYKSSA